MALNILTLGKIALPAAAVAISVFGMADDTQAHDQNTAPIGCEFAVSEGSFGQTYQGIVTANEAVRGTYQMQFSATGRNSMNISQSGNLSLQPGESRTVGQASFGGSTHVDIELTLRLNGQTLVCSNQPIDI